MLTQQVQLCSAAGRKELVIGKLANLLARVPGPKFIGWSESYPPFLEEKLRHFERTQRSERLTSPRLFNIQWSGDSIGACLSSMLRIPFAE